jgi:hypothetical protein
VGDRFPLVVVGGLLLAAVAGTFLYRGAARGGFADVLSTWRSEPDGARGLYLLAQEAGIPVDRKQTDLEVLEDGQNVVLLSVFHPETKLGQGDLFRPETTDGGVEEGALARRERGVNVFHAPPLTEDERTKLLGHVEQGHVLVYVPVGDPADPLLAALNVTLVPVTVEGADGVRHFAPAQPSPWTLGVQRAQAITHTHLGLPPGAVALLQDEQLGAAVMGLVPHGTGEVLVLSAPELAMNRRLAEADNAQLWLSLLSEVGRTGPVLFDEYHHGFSDDRSVAQFAARYGLHFAALQLVFGLCLWAVALRRFGRPRVPPEDERVVATDALCAASRLYREGRHHGHAATQLARMLARDLAPLAGLPGNALPEEVASGLQARGETALGQLCREVDRLARSAASEGDVESAARKAAHARRIIHDRRRVKPTGPTAPPRTTP